MSQCQNYFWIRSAVCFNDSVLQHFTYSDIFVILSILESEDVAYQTWDPTGCPHTDNFLSTQEVTSSLQDGDYNTCIQPFADNSHVKYRARIINKWPVFAFTYTIQVVGYDISALTGLAVYMVSGCGTNMASSCHGFGRRCIPKSTEVANGQIIWWLLCSCNDRCNAIIVELNLYDEQGNNMTLCEVDILLIKENAF